MQVPKLIQVRTAALRDPRLSPLVAVVLSLAIYIDGSPRPGAVSTRNIARILRVHHSAVVRARQRLRELGFLGPNNLPVDGFEKLFQPPPGQRHVVGGWVKVDPSLLHEEGFYTGLWLAKIADYEHHPQVEKPNGEGFVELSAALLSRAYGGSERTARRWIKRLAGMYLVIADSAKRRCQPALARLTDFRERQKAKNEALRAKKHKEKAEKRAAIREAQRIANGAEEAARAARQAAFDAEPEEQRRLRNVAETAAILARLKGDQAADVVAVNSS